MGCPIALFVNGRPRAVPPGQTLGGLLAEMGLARPGVMAAVNGEAVPAGTAAGRELRAGDQVEIVQAVAGG